MHSLRFTLGAELFERGEHPVIQYLLGRSSMVEAVHTYCRLVGDISGDAVGRLDETFG